MSAAPARMETDGATLEFWFEFASTYSYLSALRISTCAEEAGVSVIWRPFLLGPIFAGQGWDTSPFLLYPAKGRYMWRDMERLCAARGLPFTQPDRFPQNGVLAARTALAALQADPVTGAVFCENVYRAQFGCGESISDASVLRNALDQAGADPGLLARGQEPDIKAALRSQTARAQALGLFGAPSFTCGSELFWGDDRLAEALDWARTTAPVPKSAPTADMSEPVR